MWSASGLDIQRHQSIQSQTLGRSRVPTLNRAASDPGATEVKESDFGETRNEKWYSSFRKNGGKKRFDPESALPDLPSEQPLRPARNPPNTNLYDYIPFLRIFKPIVKFIKKRFNKLTRDEEETGYRSFSGRKIRPTMADSNVPVEITLFLSTYFASLMRRGLLQPASATSMVNGISALQDILANLERIKSTPLPFAYQAHLRISLW